MKAFHIVIKDMTQNFRSLFAIAFMFVIPILVTAMFAFIFGGPQDEESAYQLPVIPVQIVNLDEGEMSAILVDILRSDQLADLLDVTITTDETSARQAVDAQEASIAIIIPIDFSAALYRPDSRTAIELYQDPTLSIGPGIVTTLVNQFTDSFSGVQIAVNLTQEQLNEHGLSLSPEQLNQVIAQYSQAVTALGGERGMLQVETPSGEEHASSTDIGTILGLIMGGMMIFYAFFTGAYVSNTILTEEDNGTLARMFSTATSPATILAGKAMAGGCMILVQLIVLLVFGRLVFSIQWGNIWLLALFVLGTTIGAACFGLGIISLAKDRKQAGVIIGVGNTMTGMLGMAGTFMVNSPASNKTIETLTLFVPQGWANRALLAIMQGFAIQEVFLGLGGLLVWAAVFFILGFWRFYKRFV